MSSSSQTKFTTFQNPGTAEQKEIQVSGLLWFPEHRWREAILYYLFGIWENREEVMYRPKIHLGGITLRLNPSTGTYYAYGTSDDEECGPWVGENGEELVVSCHQLEVEIGLIRFVKNDSIRTLLIRLEDGGEICLWKTRRRSRFGIDCRGIPITM